jgi:hypothetical protein
VQRRAGLGGDVGLQCLGPCGRLHFRAGTQLDAVFGHGAGDAQRRGFDRRRGRWWGSRCGRDLGLGRSGLNSRRQLLQMRHAGFDVDLGRFGGADSPTGLRLLQRHRVHPQVVGLGLALQRHRGPTPIDAGAGVEGTCQRCRSRALFSRGLQQPPQRRDGFEHRRIQAQIPAIVAPSRSACVGGQAPLAQHPVAREVHVHTHIRAVVFGGLERHAGLDGRVRQHAALDGELRMAAHRAGVGGHVLRQLHIDGHVGIEPVRPAPPG